MAGGSLEEKKKRLAALRVKYDSLYRAYEQLLDAPVSSEYRTVREHKEEIQRLKDIKYDNPEGWSREQEARLTALVATPEYMKKFVPIVGPFLNAAARYHHALDDWSARSKQLAWRSHHTLPRRWMARCWRMKGLARTQQISAKINRCYLKTRIQMTSAAIYRAVQ